MKGFEILFGIIRSEGGAADSGFVVQDCLRICSNILIGSEICQRFFFGMGKEWVLNLHQFFDPSLVENLKLKNLFDADGAGESAWFEQPTRVGCAALALKSLAGALEVVNQKHQKLVALQTSVVPSAAFWIARKGPSELLEAALLLLVRVVQDNSEVASRVAEMMVEVSPNESGKTYPSGVEIPAVYFGWRPLPSDDRRFVTIPALLAERYIFSSTAWDVSTSPASPFDSNASNGDGNSVTKKDELSVRCLHVLETLLRADPTTCDMMIQYILAPPPPSAWDEDMARGEAAALESIRPLGAILLTTLLDGSGRFLGGNIATASSADVCVVERSANVLTLLFLSGGQLARELSTVLSTSHMSLTGDHLKYIPQFCKDDFLQLPCFTDPLLLPSPLPNYPLRTTHQIHTPTLLNHQPPRQERGSGSIKRTPTVTPVLTGHRRQGSQSPWRGSFNISGTASFAEFYSQWLCCCGTSGMWYVM